MMLTAELVQNAICWAGIGSVYDSPLQALKSLHAKSSLKPVVFSKAKLHAWTRTMFSQAAICSNQSLFIVSKSLISKEGNDL